MNEPLNLSQYSRLREALTVGDVVSVALTIARQRWKQHGGIALQATAWIFIPIIGAVVLSLGVPLMSTRSVNVGVRTGASGIMVLLVLVWLVSGIYCLGRYLANAALISRLAFNELVQGEETMAEARRYTQSRTWSYIGASLLVGVLVFTALVAAGIMMSVLFGLFAALFMGLGLSGPTSARTPVAYVFLGIGGLIAILLFLVGLTWLGSRFFFYELPMTIERETGAVSSVGRTWSLGSRSNWRLMLITTLTYLITIPIQVIAQVVMMVLLIIPQVISAQNAVLSGGLLVMSSVVNLVVNFGVVLVTMGFWQVVKAVVYFDLRNRSEGLGLVLREE